MAAWENVACWWWKRERAQGPACPEHNRIHTYVYKYIIPCRRRGLAGEGTFRPTGKALSNKQSFTQQAKCCPTSFTQQATFYQTTLRCPTTSHSSVNCFKSICQTTHDISNEQALRPSKRVLDQTCIHLIRRGLTNEKHMSNSYDLRCVGQCLFVNVLRLLFQKFVRPYIRRL